MKKFFVMSALLLGLTAASELQAQYQYWYPVPVPVRVWGPQWVYYGSGYDGYWVINSRYGQFGGFYPEYYSGYYDLNLGPRARAVLGGAALGTVIGTIAGKGKGAAIGAIVGGSIGWLASQSRNDRRQPRRFVRGWRYDDAYLNQTDQSYRRYHYYSRAGRRFDPHF